MKIIAKILEGIIWLLKPRIIEVDRKGAKFWMTYGGATLVGKKVH